MMQGRCCGHLADGRVCRRPAVRVDEESGGSWARASSGGGAGAGERRGAAAGRGRRGARTRRVAVCEREGA